MSVGSENYAEMFADWVLRPTAIFTYQEEMAKEFGWKRTVSDKAMEDYYAVHHFTRPVSKADTVWAIIDRWDGKRPERQFVEVSRSEISKKVWVPPHVRNGKPVKGYWRAGDPAGAIKDILSWSARKLSTSGGFTVHRMTGLEPKEGFSVAVDEKASLHLTPDISGPEAAAEVVTWVTKHTRKRGPSFDDKSIYFGGWKDPDTGDVWLDIIQVFPPDKKGKAIQSGKDHNQIKIFDLGKMEEIPTGGTGEVLTKAAKKKPIHFLCSMDIEPELFAKKVEKLRKQ